MALNVWQRNIVDESGAVIPNAEVEVFDAGAATKPSLFEDEAGNTSLTNPFNADTGGFARFYVAGGAYDIAVNGTVIWEHVALGTAARLDAGEQADHDAPEGKSMVARLDYLEAALGIDTAGPAGDDVLAAVGKGAIVESGSNSNGSYVRWENGEQICWRSESISFPDLVTGVNKLSNIDASLDTFPASFVGDFVSIVSGGYASSSVDEIQRAVTIINHSGDGTWGATWVDYSGYGTGQKAVFAFYSWGYWK